MTDSGDNVVRRPIKSINDFYKEFDVKDKERGFRGKFPREGYDKDTTNPLAEPKDVRRPPPLRE
jgi:hypothetical protein